MGEAKEPISIGDADNVLIEQMRLACETTRRRRPLASTSQTPEAVAAGTLTSPGSALSLIDALPKAPRLRLAAHVRIALAGEAAQPSD
jgi:hypothetical protein